MPDNKVNIIPKPVNLIYREGNFILTEQTKIESDTRLKDVADYFKNLISTATGFNLVISDIRSGLTESNRIYLVLNEGLDKLGEEGYSLEINQKNIILTAKNPVGIFCGIQTIRQLLPIEIERKAKLSCFEWVIPAVEIRDFPRFSWRGYMLDEGRHFLGKAVVKHILDLMAYFKMNVFHWHLTEDQGWRIEIKKYPKLTEIGSKRKETQIGGFLSKNMDNTPHEGFYTQEEIKEIISYADKLFIKVVPEIDIPAHSKAALHPVPGFFPP